MNKYIQLFVINKLLFILTLISLSLLSLNLYGLTQTLRPDNIELEHLRFKDNDIKISPEEFQQQIVRLTNETDETYTRRLTKVIANGLAHIHWTKFNPSQFNQTVPIWENYLLWLMGKLNITPEYSRYHFSNINKSMERGIGICGDASMLMSQLLDRYGITNKIITIPGHVMIEGHFNDKKQMFDPDFGVILEQSAEYYQEYPEHIATAYSDAGYHPINDQFIANGFRQYVMSWDGIQHFITKKYYFEKISYLLKWLIPLGLLIFVVAKVKILLRTVND